MNRIRDMTGAAAWKKHAFRSDENPLKRSAAIDFHAFREGQSWPNDDGKGAFMNRNRFLAVLATTTLIGVSAFAQAHEMPYQTNKPMEMHAAGPMMDCEAMMKKQGEMQAKNKEMDARLDQLVAAMNQADGQAKIDRTAAVVNELVAQRSQMRDRMAGMMPMMMQHMGRHMQGGEAGMAECPMMKMMHAEKEKPASPATHEH